jgi:hypothetical protein
VNGAEVLEVVFLSQDEDDAVVAVATARVDRDRGRLVDDNEVVVRVDDLDLLRRHRNLVTVNDVGLVSVLKNLFFSFFFTGSPGKLARVFGPTSPARGKPILLFLTFEGQQWEETKPSNIRFFPADIRFYRASWYYTNGL